tara:strand:- start:524 stop:742 length:219 start_codon:yes stop_codon:yes gene_type:complete
MSRGRPKSLDTVHREIMAEIEALSIKIKFNHFKSEEDNKKIDSRIKRLETIIISSYGSLILFLAGFVFTVII